VAAQATMQAGPRSRRRFGFARRAGADTLGDEALVVRSEQGLLLVVLKATGCHYHCVMGRAVGSARRPLVPALPPT
jgi:hypothetical protein